MTSPARERLAMPIQMAYHKVTVNVTDEDEDGSISLSAQQPQVGAALRATLTDQDSRRDADNTIATNPITNASWKWEQSPAMDGPWTLIPGAGAGAMTPLPASPAIPRREFPTSPVKETAGMYLRATVTYTDKHGDDKTAMMVSAHAVRASPQAQTQPPCFPPARPTEK